MTHRRRRGMSMAMTLVVLLILSVLGLAFGVLGMNNLRQIRHSEAASALLHAANGGLNELMDRMYSQPTYGSGVTDGSCDGSGTYGTSQGTAYYWWTFNTSYSKGYCTNNLGSASVRTGYQNKPVPPLTALIVVNADWVPRNLSTKPTRVAAVATKKFRFAVATDGTMDTRDIAGTSGYPGSVWSNSSSNDAIDATSIDGQAFTNAGPGSISVNGSPKGIPYYNSGTTPIPDIPVSDVVASYSSGAATHPYGGPAFYQGTGDLTLKTLSDGTLEIVTGSIIIDRGQGQLKGPGFVIPPPPLGQPARDIYVDGDLELGQASGTTLAPGFNFYTTGSLRINGGLTQLPGNAEHKDNFFFIAGVETQGNKSYSILYNGAQGSSIHMFAESSIIQNGSSQYAGVVYVRDGNFDIAGGGTNSNFEGAVLIRGTTSSKGNLGGNTANFTYNPAYVTAMERFNVSFSENTPVYTVSWWIER